MTRFAKIKLGLVGAVMASFGGMAAAEPAEKTSITADQYLDYLNALSTQSQTRIRSRASTLGIPSGFAVPANVGYFAVAASDRRERTGSQKPDGSVALGFGAGDAAESVGVEFSLGISSLGKGEGSSVDLNDVGDSGSISVKLARQVASPFNNGAASIAAGVGRAARWGDVTASKPSYYVAGTSTFAVPAGASGSLQGIVTAGLATSIGTAEDKDGGFIGLGLGLNKWLSVGGSFYGDEVIAGLNSFHKLSPNTDMQLSLSFGDVTQRNSDGRVMFSVALIGTHFQTK